MSAVHLHWEPVYLFSGASQRFAAASLTVRHSYTFGFRDQKSYVTVQGISHSNGSLLGSPTTGQIDHALQKRG